MRLVFFIVLFLIGTCLGSFLCCQARRLHLRSTPKTAHKPSLGRRSICLHCHYQLKWYDNIPIISWLLLKGKCRKCHHKIGVAEILSELGLGLAFVGVGFHFFIPNTITFATSNPLIWTSLITALVFVSILAFLAIYDGLYGKLPTLPLAASIVSAIIMLVLNEWQLLLSAPFAPEHIYLPLLSVLILGGTYLMLYLISTGRWVGDGDWLLGTAIAIALYSPWLAVIALFLANFIACLIMYPVVKSRKNHRIYLGPFLTIAFIITYSFSNFLLSVL